MRIGMSLTEPAGPGALTALRDQLQQAADDGFASAWMSNIFGVDALTALAVAGSQVAGIELGTAVVPTYPRHPAVLAQQALTVSLAVGGRLALGIGLSHRIVIEDMYGYSFERPARHMSEYLSILLPLLNGENAAFEGDTMRAGIGLSVPRPARVPVLLAALGPAMLRLAGERADGTVLWMTGPATVRDYITPAITQAAAPPGGRPRGSSASCRSASPTTPARPGRARPRSSPSTGSSRPTAPCSTGKARRDQPTSPSPGTRTRSARRSWRWPAPA